MSNPAIIVNNLSKEYKIGSIIQKFLNRTLTLVENKKFYYPNSTAILSSRTHSILFDVLGLINNMINEKNYIPLLAMIFNLRQKISRLFWNGFSRTIIVLSCVLLMTISIANINPDEMLSSLGIEFLAPLTTIAKY